jgi:hypothetical protein
VRPACAAPPDSRPTPRRPTRPHTRRRLTLTNGQGPVGCPLDKTARVVSISVSFAFVRGHPPTVARTLRRRSRTVPTGGGHCTGVLKIGRSTVRPRPWPPALISLFCRSLVHLCPTSCPIPLLTLAPWHAGSRLRRISPASGNGATPIWWLRAGCRSHPFVCR